MKLVYQYTLCSLTFELHLPLLPCCHVEAAVASTLGLGLKLSLLALVAFLVTAATSTGPQYREVVVRVTAGRWVAPDPNDNAATAPTLPALRCAREETGRGSDEGGFLSFVGEAGRDTFVCPLRGARGWGPLLGGFEEESAESPRRARFADDAPRLEEGRTLPLPDPLGAY